MYGSAAPMLLVVESLAAAGDDFRSAFSASVPSAVVSRKEDGVRGAAVEVEGDRPNDTSLTARDAARLGNESLEPAGERIAGHRDLSEGRDLPPWDVGSRWARIAAA